MRHTPDDRSRRAASAFIGCGLAIVCAFGLVRNVEVHSDWRLDDSERGNGFYAPYNGKPMGPRPVVWHQTIVDESLCHITHHLTVSNWTIPLASHPIRHAKIDREEGTVRWGSYAIMLVLVFGSYRAGQLLARAIVPASMKPVDESDEQE